MGVLFLLVLTLHELQSGAARGREVSKAIAAPFGSVEPTIRGASPSTQNMSDDEDDLLQLVAMASGGGASGPATVASSSCAAASSSSAVAAMPIEDFEEQEELSALIAMGAPEKRRRTKTESVLAANVTRLSRKLVDAKEGLSATRDAAKQLVGEVAIAPPVVARALGLPHCAVSRQTEEYAATKMAPAIATKIRCTNVQAKAP